MRPLVQLGAACFSVLFASLIGCNRSDQVGELREKFSVRRTDLELLRAMAEEDHLMQLELEPDRRINPTTITPNRAAEYRSILERLGGLWIVRWNEHLISIPMIKRGWPVPFSVCGYLFVPKGTTGVGEKMPGLIPLDSQWFVECHSRK